MEGPGRPTVMDENTLRILEGAFADGASDKLACFLANIAESTLYKYQVDNPGFLERKEYLKDQVKFQAKKVLREAINSGDKETAKWYLERRDKEFKQKADLTTNDKDIPSPIIQIDALQPNNSNKQNTSTEEES